MKNFLLLLGLSALVCNFSSAQKVKFKKVPAELLAETACPYDKSAKAERIYHSTLVEFEYDTNNQQFDVAYYVHDRIKIYDAEDTDWADYTISYYKEDDKKSAESIRELEAYTFYLEGDKVEKIKLSKKSIFDEEVSKFYSVKKFAMPGVKSGVVIDIKYKKVSPFVFNIDEFYFQSKIPTRLATYEILAPEYFNYNFNAKGIIPLDLSSETSQGSFTYSFKVKNPGDRLGRESRRRSKVSFQLNERKYIATEVPAIKSEPYVYTMDNYKSSIKTELLYTNYPDTPIKYFTKSWTEIGDLLMDSDKFGKELKRDYDDLEEIVALAEGKTPIEKVELIYAEIQNRYSWNEYSSQYCNKGIKKLIKEGTGNVAEINLLLVNVLRKAGLTAFPMASRRSTSGFLNITNPSLSELDYVTAVVIIDDKVTHLDATSKYLQPGMLPSRALNLKGIVVDKENSQELPIANPNSGGTSRIYEVETQGNEMKGTVSGGTKGYSLYLRKDKAKSKDEFVKNMNTDDLNFTDVEVTGYESNNSVKYKGSATIKNAIQEVDGKIFIDLSAAQGDVTNPFVAEERDFAMFFESKGKSTEILKIKIPDGYIVESMPEKLNVASPDMMITYLIEVSKNNGFLMITNRSSLNAAMIPPAYYPSIKDLYGMVESKYGEKIVLAKAE